MPSQATNEFYDEMVKKSGGLVLLERVERNFVEQNFVERNFIEFCRNDGMVIGRIGGLAYGRC